MTDQTVGQAEATAKLNEYIGDAWQRWCTMVASHGLGDLFAERPPLFTTMGIRVQPDGDLYRWLGEMAFIEDQAVIQPVDGRRIATIVKAVPLAQHIYLIKFVEPRSGQNVASGPYHIDLMIDNGYNLEALATQLKARGITAVVEHNFAHHWLSVIDPNDPYEFEFKLLVAHSLLNIAIDGLSHGIPALLNLPDSD